MIAGQMFNNEITFALDLSEDIIKAYVQDIFDKLAVPDRMSAADSAIERRLVRTEI